MEDTSWQYGATLKRCRAFLVNEYTIKPQVCDLVLYLHEQNHITYNQTQDINETHLTSDKMQRLIGILIDFAPEELETQEVAHTKLVLACERGDMEKVEEILTKTPDCVNITNKNGETILMLSCSNANVNVVKTLLKCQVIDVNTRDNTGKTALVKSVIRGDIEVLSLMLDYQDLELSIRDDKGVTYLCYVFGMEAANFLPDLQRILKLYTQSTLFLPYVIEFISTINELQKAMDWVKVDKVVKCLLSKNNVNHTDLLKTCLILGIQDVVALVLQSLGQEAIDREEMKDYSYSISASINPANTKVLLELGLIDLNDLAPLQVEAITESVMRHGCHDLCAYLYKMIRDLEVNKALKTALFLQSISPHILSDILEGMNYDFEKLHVTDAVGNSVFAILCKNSTHDTVKELLGQKQLLLKESTILNMKNEFGESPLILGCQRGDPDIVRLLLNNDAQVNVESEYPETPLTAACDSGKIEIVELLLNKKADLNMTNKWGHSPLIIACLRGDPDIVRLLLNNEDRVNVGSEYPETPLTAACMSGRVDIVELLVKKKADLNMTNKWGLSPLMSACSGGHLDIVKLLLNNDAQVNVVSEYGETPLTAACWSGKIEIVELLLKKKGDLNMTNKLGQSPLMSACSGGHPDIVRLLLNNNAQVNVVDVDGDTPLLEACRSGDIEVVKLLLKEKVDVNACNKFGNAPLQTARLLHRDSIVELLLEHKPDVVD